jgi:hypothetical protein
MPTPSALLTRLAVLVLAALPLAACDEPEFGAVRAPIPVVVPQRPALPPEPPPQAAPADPLDIAADGMAEPPPAPVSGAPLVIIPQTPVAPLPAAPAAAPAAPAAAPAAGDNPLLAQQRAACAREGGRLQSLASGLVSCIRQTGDAGRSCTQASDCEGVCLARSGTCAPITPLYGCHEVLLAPGNRVTQCLD